MTGINQAPLGKVKRCKKILLHFLVFFYAAGLGLFSPRVGMGKLFGQEATDLLAAVRSFRQEKAIAILQEYFRFLSLPNVASDRENIRKNANFLLQMLEQRGIETRLFHCGDAPPVVYGELKSPQARATIVFYAHYDGQPVDPSRWASDPWKPVILDRPLEEGGKAIDLASPSTEISGEARIYGRSASDDKAPIMAMLAALDALKAAGIPLTVNLKFFFEGEEEAGSPHLESILEANREFLQADLWVVCDGPVHQSRRPIIYFGARGIAGLEITVFGPIRPLHSGHYGNWAPNPASFLAVLLASMRDVEGNILIDGFYRDVRPLSAEEIRILKSAPAIDKELKEELKIGWSEGAGSIYERIMLPAMNLRGLRAGNVAEAAQNAIPTEARASIDFRLVPDQTPERVRDAVEAHLRKMGCYLVYEEPDVATRLKHPKITKLKWEAGYPAAQTSASEPAARALVQSIEAVLGASLIKLPLVGGSIPLYLFRDLLHAPAVILPIVNHDNNQHGENENLRLQNLWDGIDMFAGIFSGFGNFFRPTLIWDSY